MTASLSPAAAAAERGPGGVCAQGSETLSRVARLAARLLDAPYAVVARPGDPSPRLGGSAGIPRVLADGSLPLGALLTGRVLAAREPVALPSAGAEIQLRRDLEAGGLDAVAFLGVPVLSAGGRQPLGVLAVFDSRPRRWAAEEIATLEELAGMAAAELGREQADAESETLATELWWSEARYRRLVEMVGMGIGVVDASGCVAELNAVGAEILGRPIHEVLGRPFSELVAPEDLERAGREFRERIAGKVDRTPMEFRVLRPTGERRYLLVSAEPIGPAEGGSGVYCVVRDVTDERTREAELRRAERMASIAPLLTGVCHELNNPLTSIKSFAELLLLDDRAPEDREALEIVRREATRASRIVSDLRVVARQTRDGETGRGAVDLNEVVLRALDLRCGSLSTQEVTVRRELAPDLPVAWGVQTQLEQVILHLLTNAEQALKTKTGSRDLVVRTYPCELGIGITVEDNGPGIAPDHLDKIFDPFFTTRAAGEGTGLGLSLVHGIISDHGARIKAESELGKGAVFTIEIPAAQQEPSTLGPADVDTGSTTTRPLRILVVDDEAPIRYSLIRYMERRGHEVDEAPDGASALERLDAIGGDAPGYDIILADLRMPGLSGDMLFDQLRRRIGNLEERLIFITGDADSPDVADVLRAAGVPVVLKPFELAEIAQIIEVQARMTLA